MKAYELIQQGWTQRAPARDKNGCRTCITDPNAIQFCMVGAIYRCYDAKVARQKLSGLAAYLYNKYSNEKLIGWNDKRGRTKKEVIQVLKFLDI